jgi:hypothetical protein
MWLSPLAFVRGSETPPNWWSTVDAQRDAAPAELLATTVDVFNVKSFGAIGDGSTDDTVTIAAALVAATAGDTVYFPRGTYIISTTLTVPTGVTLLGNGRSSLIASAPALPDLNLLTLTTLTDVAILNLGLKAGSRSYDTDPNRVLGNCILSNDCTSLLVEGCHFSQFHNAIMDDNGSELKILNNTFVMNHDGFACGHFRGTAESVVANNHMEDTHTTGAINAIWWYDGENEAEGIVIANNFMGGFNRKPFETINIFAHEAVVIGNTIIGTDNTDGAGASNEHRGIDVATNLNEADNHYIVVADNIIEKEGVGVRVKALSNGFPMKNVTVRGNVIRDCSQTGIKIEGSNTAGRCLNMEVSNNTIIGTVDLASVDISSGCGIFVNTTKGLVVADNVIENSDKKGIFLWEDTTEFTVVGNFVSASDEEGIAVVGVTNRSGQGTVAHNMVSASRQHGIQIFKCDDVVVDGNMCIDNGVDEAATYAGIVVESGDRHVVSNNVSRVSASGVKQAYGINLVATIDYVTVRGNIVDQNRTANINLQGGTPTNLFLNENLGYVTEADGTATVANATMSIAVTHGLARTPGLDDIQVTPTNDLGSAAKFWISSPTSTQFTINVDVDPGATTATFAWKARVE